MLSRERYRLIHLLLLLLTPAAVTLADRASLAPATSRLSTNEAALVSVWQEESAHQTIPVENMQVPIAHHPDGRVKALLRAAKAWLPPNESGYLRARDVVIETFDDDGRLDGIFITDNCFFDRATSYGYCEGNVRVEQRGMRIEGVGMVWNLETRSAKILAEAQVTINRFMQQVGKAFK